MDIKDIMKTAREDTLREFDLEIKLGKAIIEVLDEICEAKEEDY